MLDTLCGSGMTGGAALMEKRNALLSDFSPAAVHVARNYTSPCDPTAFAAALAQVEKAVLPTIDWLYRPIGADRIVDGFIFSCTHSCEIDWLLPGVAPTGKYFEVPMLAVVCFRGDKLYNEHIYWDQASVLVQVGLLNPEGLPVAGIESARKLLDETLPSNQLMGSKSRV